MAPLQHPAMELGGDLKHVISLGFSGDFKENLQFITFCIIFHHCGMSVISFDKSVLNQTIAESVSVTTPLQRRQPGQDTWGS